MQRQQKIHDASANPEPFEVSFQPLQWSNTVGINMALGPEKAAGM